jgi:molybdate transport system regulatory protein
MQTSARNMFPGTVTNVTKGAVNAEIELTLANGGKIIAGITNVSVDRLGLKPGVKAVALIKASWIILGKDLHAKKLSTRNILCGTVDKVQEGAVNSEVLLKLDGGHLLTTIITNVSAHALGFKKGDHACAAFKAGHVILGVD